MIQRVALAVVASLCAAVAAAACSAPATGAGPDAASVPPPGDGAGSCPPRPVTPPPIKWIPPHALHGNVCTPQDAAAIASCFVQAQSCEVLVSATCHGCAVSGDSSASSAALIVHDQSGNTDELNIAGCVGALSGDPSASGCGAKLAARDACITSACTACTDSASLSSCATRAATTVCAAANADAQCAAPYLPQCNQGTTELEVAFNLVRVFCGP
jgi:hypothetical protein